MLLKKLHRSFVLLCRRQRRKCSQISSFPGLRIFLSRVQAELTRFQFANHEQKDARQGVRVGARRPEQTAKQTLLSRIVVQVLPQPPLDFASVHSFAAAVVSNLITLDLTQTEIARFRMREVKAAHA